MKSTPSRETHSRLRADIFLVEDHPVTRAGISALVSRDPHLRVCGVADSAPVAFDLIIKARPALVVMDIALKTSNGLDLMKNLMAELPDLLVLVMSMHDENVYAERALRAGARGYLMKNDAAEKIIVAIRTILAGDLYFSEPIKARLVKSSATKRTAGSPLVTKTRRAVAGNAAS